MFEYGEKVVGFEEGVLNEREARAGAGIMLLFGFLAMANCFMLSSALFAKYYITFFMIDFLIRIIRPRYSPSLLLARLFIQNQDPEYVGAKQKRFSWTLGFLSSLYMFYAFVIVFDINLFAILLCFLCLTMLFLEAAFSICIGCFIYGLIDEHKVMYCPGGSCQLKFKTPIQRFDAIQKVVVALSVAVVLGFSYYYIFHVETKTYMGKQIKEYFMTEEDWKIQNELEYQRDLEAFESEDF